MSVKQQSAVYRMELPRTKRMPGQKHGHSLANRPKTLVLGLLIGALLFSLTGCDGFFVPDNNNPTTSGNYLYVANGGNTYIAGFSIGSSGKLTSLPNSPYNNGIAALAITVTPKNVFLYAGTTNGIYAYAINGDGSLTVKNGGSPVAQDVIATALQVDSTGTYLLAAGLASATQSQAIGIYQINGSDGTLSALTGSPLTLYTGSGSSPALSLPTAMLITPNNSYVYVSLGNLGVQVLTLGSGGALSTGSSPTILRPSSGSTTPSDYGLASDPGSKFLFVAELNTGLRVLSIGTGGALNEVTGSPYAGGTGTIATTVDPTGAYVYVANKGSNNISAFTLNASSGQLTQISGSPFASGGQIPIGLATDSSKKYLAVINSGSNGSSNQNDLQIFSYSSSAPGALSAGATASTGTDPTNPQSIAATHPSS
jgi:6-phosphogluconolactonase (cycloisomerase 2 family)